MGDAGISSSSLQTFYDAFAFHANFLRLLADDQQKGCTDQPTTTIYSACRAPPNAPAGLGAAAWFNGSVPDVTPFPTGPYGGNPGSTDWQTAFPVIARNVLLHYGARARPLLAELWPSLERFMAYLERLIEHSPTPRGRALGLLLDGARGDWIPPEGNMGGPYPTPTPPISAFWHTLCVGYMAEIAEAIGNTAAASFYTARLEKNRKAYHEYFYNGLGSADAAAADPEHKRCCYDTGSQTNNVFALHLGAVPDELVNDTVAMLVASIKDRNADHPHHAGVADAPPAPAAADSSERAAPFVPDPRLPPHWIQDASKPLPPPFGSGAHLDCGIFGTTFIFEVLHKHGADAVGIDVLTEASFPSFGRMIEQGATTLWESWGGDEHTIGSTGTSRNHVRTY
jgi:hypothetical protein